MDNKRRQFLKSGLAVGGLGAFAAGYATTTKHMVEGALEGTAGEKRVIFTTVTRLNQNTRSTTKAT